MKTPSLFEREALPQLQALRRFAMRLCRDGQRSSDLVQDTMFKAYRYFHTYKEGTNCRAWLFQICKNTYINEYRRKHYETIPVDVQREIAGSYREHEAGREPTLHPYLSDHSLAQSESGLLADEIASALDALPPDYQTAVILNDIEGHTYKEIAQFMRTPIGTIRSRIHRGRKMLANHLAEYAHRGGYTKI